MSKNKSVKKQLLDSNKMCKYLVSFDLVLKKPVSERFSSVNECEVVPKKEIFYSRGVDELKSKVSLTYRCSGRIANLQILKTSSITA